MKICKLKTCELKIQRAYLIDSLYISNYCNQTFAMTMNLLLSQMKILESIKLLALVAIVEEHKTKKKKLKELDIWLQSFVFDTCATIAVHLAELVS